MESEPVTSTVDRFEEIDIFLNNATLQPETGVRDATLEESDVSRALEYGSATAG